MHEHLKDIFEYNHHFNQKLFALLAQHYPDLPVKTLRLINHLVNAQQIWNVRINGGTPFEVWQLNNWNELAGIDDANYQMTLKIITEKDLDGIIAYSNSKGEKFSNKVKDVLFHVINHSTYHRAQIATDLKLNGIEPINTDYIFYKRKLE